MRVSRNIMLMFVTDFSFLSRTLILGHEIVLFCHFVHLSRKGCNAGFTHFMHLPSTPVVSRDSAFRSCCLCWAPCLACRVYRTEGGLFPILFLLHELLMALWAWAQSFHYKNLISSSPCRCQEGTKSEWSGVGCETTGNGEECGKLESTSLI